MFEINIRRSYSCIIHYEASTEDSNKIEDKAFKWESGVELETFSGCAACSPYLKVTSDSITDVQKWRDKIVRYMRRFKSVRFIH